eukprot:2180030-Rhodomonas_salina.2
MPGGVSDTRPAGDTPSFTVLSTAGRSLLVSCLPALTEHTVSVLSPPRVKGCRADLAPRPCARGP